MIKNLFREIMTGESGVKETLKDSVNGLLAKSAQIKSVFVTMKADLTATNVELVSKRDEVDEFMESLIQDRDALAAEINSNKTTITNIDKIIG